MNTGIYKFIILFILQGVYAWSQASRESSFLATLKNTKPDTVRISLLNNLAWEVSLRNPDTALLLSKQAFTLGNAISAASAARTKQSALEGSALAIHQIASFYLMKGDFGAAKKFYDQALAALDDLEVRYPERKNIYESKKSATIGDLGHLYSNLGQYPEALNAYLEALKIDEASRNQEGVGRHLGSVGNIYYILGDNEKALNYLNRGLKINESIHNDVGIASILVNMGGVYHALSKYDKSLEYLFRALDLDKRAGNKQGQAIVTGNIAVMYDEMGDHEKATQFYTEAIKENEEVGNLSNLALHLGNFGLLLTDQHKYAEAEDFLQRSLKLASEIGFKDDIRTGHENLAMLYSQIGNDPKTTASLKNGYFEKSLDHYKQAALIKDSLFNDEKNRELTRHEMNYEFQKKENAVKAAQEKKDALAEASRKQQRIIILIVAVALVLGIGFATFIFRSLRIARRQKKLIELKTVETERQKHIIQEKNKDVLDSIYYARRIQQSLLPTEKYIDRHMQQLKN